MTKGQYSSPRWLVLQQIATDRACPTTLWHAPELAPTSRATRP